MFNLAQLISINWLNHTPYVVSVILNQIVIDTYISSLDTFGKTKLK